MKNDSTGSNGAYALSYAKTCGWYVFPAPVGEKKSHKSAKHSGGRNWGATIDEKEVKRDFKRWSKANVGVVTGPDSGIFVVEADTVKGHGVDGIASLEELQQKHGELPHTLVAESPSGSLHYYFNYPAGVTVSNSTSKVAPGVDVRGNGGMVIAPPSRKPNGQCYRWLYNWPIADAPAWLIELCAAGGDDAKRTTSNEKLLADDLDKLAYAVGVIKNDLREYNEWKKFGMAIFAATGGSGFGLFDGFSKKWTNGTYDEDNVQTAWQQISGSPPTKIGAKWIYRKADKAAPGWRASYEEMRSAASTAEDKAKAEEQKAKAKAREEELLAALVKAEGLDYERQRKEAQEELRVSARAIDNEVKARREDAQRRRSMALDC
jgi:Bifunctional DNA primase/polymerase, N-terminal/Primase C terminal 2 (PriCT-2)